jgi:hypothetical protein
VNTADIVFKTKSNFISIEEFSPEVSNLSLCLLKIKSLESFIIYIMSVIIKPDVPTVLHGKEVVVVNNPLKLLRHLYLSIYRVSLVCWVIIHSLA